MYLDDVWIQFLCKRRNTRTLVVRHGDDDVARFETVSAGDAGVTATVLEPPHAEKTVATARAMAARVTPSSYRNWKGATEVPPYWTASSFFRAS